MDAVDILKVCLRRWYIMLPILLGAAGVSFQLVQAQETTFTAAASYGLVQTDPPPSDASGTEAAPNPLGANGGALIGAALEAQLNSRATQEELGGEGTRGWGAGEVENGSSYSVKIPQFETTYEVRAWGEDEQAVRAVVDRVIEAAPGIADTLQTRAGAPRAGRYQPFILAPTQVDALPSTSGMKLVVAVMGIGLLMGAAWSVVADRVLRQLRRQRAVAEPQAGRGTTHSMSPLEALPATESPPTVNASNGQARAQRPLAGQPDRGTRQRRRTGGR
ncbi:hypothetical protein CF8_3184 [Nocardioides sp. CF8]|uniref:hypothetical protein n=1 Tax=Nocardioides sp. CF8 TaxID=110319 RepID=UPI00032DE6E3|nr:hypothetical protein [Nocardioides sp. CF8]EON22945.1 hypothetical protein CF8_3184 [Nocardioides sp. CF8]